jgi:retinol dehydrogenase-14
MGGAGGGPLADGADTPLWLLTDPALDGTTGGFFYRRRPATANPQAEDADARRRLWDLAAAQVALDR